MTGGSRTGHRYVGQRTRRVNDPGLLRGEARFVDDLRMPGLLHAVIIRSTVAHGRLTRLEAHRAATMPGVVAVLGPGNIDAATRPMPCAWVLPGQRQSSTPVVDTDIRYVGQPLGVVVAGSVGRGLDALDALEIDYDELPAATDVEDAHPPLLYPDIPANLAIDLRVGTPTAEMEQLFAGAAHVVAGRFRLQRQTGSPIETRGVVASHDPSSKALTVWTSTQVPHTIRDELAAVLAIPHNLVRVIAPQVGGGFGPKDHLYPDEVMVCAASRLLGAPVKWIEQRGEHAKATVHARDQVHDARLALDECGRFIALDSRIVVDLGAACSNVGGGPAFTTAALLEGPYRFEAAGATVRGVVTNKTPAGAYRGFGQAEAAWVRERLVDLAAGRLDLAPVELRRRNMIRSAELPFVTHSGQSYDSGDYLGAMERAHELIASTAPSDRDGRRRGTGVASYIQFAGSATQVERHINFRIPGYETVVLRVEPDGSATVHTGVCPHGQGLETTLAQLAADGLGIAIEDITVVSGDTSTTPYSTGTIASRSLMLGGGAVIRAAARMKARLVEMAAWKLEAAVEDLDITDGHVAVRGSPSRSVTVAALARDAWLGWDLPPGCEPGLEVRDTFDPEDCAYSYATHAAAVAVDLETGKLEVERYVVVQDCGVIVNPMIVEGQIHGGVVQGIGGALYESIVYDGNGQLLTATLVDYGLPTTCEVPNIVIEHLEHPTPRVPGGMKGMAEGGVVPTAAAIGNALAAAVPEIAEMVTETPLDPQRVWSWLERARHD